MEQDNRLPLIKEWLANTSIRPSDMSDKDYLRFVRRASLFFLDKEGRMYRRNIDAAHQLVVDQDHRMYMLKASHDSLGHRGFFATKEMIGKRFWWPEFERDVSWYVKTCHLCQIRQKTLLRIPPTITHTPSIFQVLHADTLYMSPKSNGHSYIVHSRCALTSWMEGAALKKEDAKLIATWLFEEVICRWGCLSEIVTDNGKPYTAAVAWLESKFGIKGIRISAYNSRANGKIERPHWDVRQALFKATGGDISKWFFFFPHTLWADRVTIRRGSGCAPFFMVTGANPVLPLDIVEATCLVKSPDRVLSTAELIGYRAQALAKHSQHVADMRKRTTQEKRARLVKYEEEHWATIKDYDFTAGDLVLVRNTDVEMSLDKKMKPCYLGPMIVLRRNKGGAYIVCELDGSVWQSKVAAFRVIPYFKRTHIELPENLQELIDVSDRTLKALADSALSGDDGLYKDRDYTFDNVILKDPDEDTAPDVEDSVEAVYDSDSMESCADEDDTSKHLRQRQ